MLRSRRSTGAGIESRWRGRCGAIRAGSRRRAESRSWTGWSTSRPCSTGRSRRSRPFSRLMTTARPMPRSCLAPRVSTARARISAPYTSRQARPEGRAGIPWRSPSLARRTRTRRSATSGPLPATQRPWRGKVSAVSPRRSRHGGGGCSNRRSPGSGACVSSRTSPTPITRSRRSPRREASRVSSSTPSANHHRPGATTGPLRPWRITSMGTLCAE